MVVAEEKACVCVCVCVCVFGETSGVVTGGVPTCDTF
jgi:hypothetical protein